jgi:hypothetical protein
MYVFLTSALVVGEWSASHLGHFTPGEKGSGTNWIGGWVDPRAGLDNVEKRKFLTLSELEHRPRNRPSHSHSLYRLCYPGSWDSDKVGKEDIFKPTNGNDSLHDINNDNGFRV